MANDVDLQCLAQATPGFTGADLSSLVRFAMTQALERWTGSDDKVKAHVALCCLWSRLCMIIVVVVLLLLLLILLLAVANAQPSMTHSYITGKPHFQFQQRVTSYASHHHPCSVTLPVQPLNHFELALHRCTMRHLASKPAMPPNQFELVLHRHTKSLLLY